MHPTVRLATDDDCAGIVRVVKAVFDEYSFTWEADGYHADLYDVDSYYTKQGHSFFVSVAGKEVLGVIALRIFSAIPGPVGEVVEVDGKRRIAGSDCSLDRLYVLPSARRQGIGMALATAVVDAAKFKNRRLMEIWSDKRFVDAHRLYRRLGAVSVSDRVLDDPDHSPEWGLKIDL